jgi:vacuolar protein-sorting-associated protein 4
MNGIGNSMEGVLVLAATNMPWVLDVGIRRRFEKRIYISLPDSASRAKMFEIHLGTTPHVLTYNDFRELGDLTDGYSGSDISIVVREALMMPVRQVQNATHFKRLLEVDPDLFDRQGINFDPSKDYYTPCSPGDPNGEAKTWLEIDGQCLIPPIVTKSHFMRSIRNTRPTVNRDEISRHIQFTEEFGQEG